MREIRTSGSVRGGGEQSSLPTSMTFEDGTPSSHRSVGRSPAERRPEPMRSQAENMDEYCFVSFVSRFMRDVWVPIADS